MEADTKASLLSGFIGLVGAGVATFWPKKASAADVPIPTPREAAAAQQGGQQCEAAFQAWQQATQGALAAWATVEGLEPSKNLPGTDVAYKQALDRAISATNFSAGKMAEYEACMAMLGLDPHRPSEATR